MARVQVHLLGEAKIALGIKSLPLRPNKRCQLLAYLAYQDAWVSREGLQYLFWSDSPPEIARGNLRQLLFRVSAMDIGKGLITEHQHLRWQVKTDVAAFRAAIEQKQWQDALKHYGGSLLPRLEGDEVTEFTNWLTLERERLHQSWRQALLNRAEALVTSASYLEAAELLKTLVDGDELDDEALKNYMQTMWQVGGRDQALKAYKDFAKRLRQELDLSPTAELEQLAKRIRTQERVQSESSTLVPPALQSTVTESTATENKRSSPTTPSLPTLANAFVGRDFELNDVTERLLNPECRLLTLVGMGGMGKTSLAVRSAEHLASTYPDGVYFVGLDALSTSSLIPSTIADSLKLTLRGQDEPLVQLVRFIGEKELLLVLDNFEHLLEAATLVSTLLQGCLKLNVLVTSRERLNVEEEWLLNVEGLNYPQNETLPLEESLYFDAIKLFVQRAGRVRPEFVLTQEELPYLLDICRLVEGSPLGLELAAVWVRLMPLREIAEEIKGNIDFLASSSRNKTERHRSLRAVFEHSWELLTPKEQEVLRKLSVFVGGFSKEAARQVVGASLPILAALVDKSLLKVSTTGRYDRHLLVYQYSHEKLAEDNEEKQQTEEQHALYYLHFVQEQADAFHTRKRKMAKGHIEENLDNIRKAWDWAVTEKNVDALERSTFALSVVFEGRRQEGLSLFSRAAAVLVSANPEQQVALAYLLIEQAEKSFQPFSYDTITALAKRGLALLEPFDKPRAVARGLRILSNCEKNVGNFTEGTRLLQEALVLAREYGMPEETGRILGDLALHERQTSHSEAQTKDFMVQALNELRDIGNLNRLSYVLLLYGAYLVYQDQVDEGEKLLHESLRLAEELGGDQDYLPYILLDLARGAYKRAAFDEAERFLHEALRRTGERNRHGMATALSLLGRVATAKSAFEEARDYFRQSLHVGWKYQQWLVVSMTLVFVAELKAAQGQVARAAELLTLLQGQEVLEKRDRDEAKQLMTNLASQLPPQDFAAAQARGAALELREVVMSLLSPAPEDQLTLEEASDPS